MTTETVRTNTPPTKLETAGSSNPPVCRQCALWKDPQSSLLWDLSSYPQICLPATCDCGRTTQLSFFPFFFFFFWPRNAAYEILVSQPGIEPGPPAVRARSTTCWWEIPTTQLSHWAPQFAQEKTTHWGAERRPRSQDTKELCFRL